MKAAEIYKSIYVMFYRWSFRNFGQGTLPRFKSLFNVSFLMVILVTNLMLITQLVIREQWFKINFNAAITILLVSVVLLMISHLIFLNNKWFKQLNEKLAVLSHHNRNTWSVMLLANVVISCGLLLFLVK